MTRTLYVALLLMVAGCSAGDAPSNDTYNVEIRWTSYGIPHVKADDWGSLGYGFAYATATDAVCVIAKDIAMVNGNLSSFSGPDGGNFESDVFHRLLLTPGRLQRFVKAQTPQSGDFARGYVAGYNRYLADHDGQLPESCNGAAWIRPMVEEDVARLTVGVGIRYGLGRFKNDIARAQPQNDSHTAADTAFQIPAGLGSNAVAFGKAVTATGSGILLGNPHYPWHGSSRFHLIHTTIPGVMDTMGVSLYTTAAVGIGFNKDIAWTHTVSTALRFTLYELELNPDNALQYRYGDEFRDMEVRQIAIDLQQENGDTKSVQHTVYSSHYGPILVSEQLPWTTDKAYSIRDAVLDNTAGVSTYAALNMARSVDEVEAAISRQGVFWTNTVATDRHGTTFYADISSTPNVNADLMADCRVSPPGIPAFVVVLDGSNVACEWREDSRSRVAGTLPADEMPRLRRDDYVTNSNDSYWLANPDEPLEGYSPIIGPERTPRTLRTRAGLSFVAEKLAGGDKMTADDMREILDSHRNFGAELFLDDVLKVCDGQAEIAASCEVLRQWDRTAGIGSVGNHIWTEFWRIARNIDNLYTQGFDANDAANTPHGIAIDNPAVRTAVHEALADSEKILRDAGIAMDAKWGDIQYASRNGKNIPIPGAQGWAGMFSMIVANLQDDRGYGPIIAGNSYIQVISWDENGRVQPTGMLSYSQSQEADSAHYADLTELYSQGEWLRFPFFEEEIAADPNLELLSLSE